MNERSITTARWTFVLTNALSMVTTAVGFFTVVFRDNLFYAFGVSLIVQLIKMLTEAQRAKPENRRKLPLLVVYLSALGISSLFSAVGFVNGAYGEAAYRQKALAQLTGEYRVLVLNSVQENSAQLEYTTARLSDSLGQVERWAAGQAVQTAQSMEEVTRTGEEQLARLTPDPDSGYDVTQSRQYAALAQVVTLLGRQGDRDDIDRKLNDLIQSAEEEKAAAQAEAAAQNDLAVQLNESLRKMNRYTDSTSLIKSIDSANRSAARYNGQAAAMEEVRNAALTLRDALSGTGAGSLAQAAVQRIRQETLMEQPDLALISDSCDELVALSQRDTALAEAVVQLKKTTAQLAAQTRAQQTLEEERTGLGSLKAGKDWEEETALWKGRLNRLTAAVSPCTYYDTETGTADTACLADLYRQCDDLTRRCLEEPDRLSRVWYCLTFPGGGGITARLLVLLALLIDASAGICATWVEELRGKRREQYTLI